MRASALASLFVLGVIGAVALPSRAAGQLWDVPLYDVATMQPADHHRAAAVAFTRDGKRVVTGGFYFDSSAVRWSGEIRFFDTETGEVAATWRKEGAGYCTQPGTLAVSPDGKSIAVAGWHGNSAAARARVVDFWDVERQEIRQTFDAAAPVMQVGFSRDGRIAAYALLNLGGITAIDLDSGKTRWVQAGGPRFAFSPDGQLFAAADGQGQIVLLSPKTGERLGAIRLSEDGESVGPVAFAPDGKSIAAAFSPEERDSGPTAIRRWRLAESAPEHATVTAKPEGELEGHGVGNWIYSLAFAPDGKTLASCGQDCTVRLWSLETGEEVASFTGHRDFVYDVAFSPDGKHLVSLGRDSLQYRSLAGTLDHLAE